MGTLRTAIQIFDGVSRPMKNMNQALQTVIQSFEAIDEAAANAVDVSAIQKARNEIIRLNADMEFLENEIRRIKEQQEQANKKFSQAQHSMSGVLGVAKNLAATLGFAFGLNAIKNLADDMTLTTARLNLINDGLQTTAELQDKIFKSAQRSRASYQTTADIVSKLGMQAKRAFSSNDELIAFAELLNKTFVIAGTDASGIESTMYNLTQALASGVLRGQDLNAVMSNAQPILENVANYLGVGVEKIRDMAAEGQLSAEVIKNAMFAAADETNEKFKAMPMTFHQVGTIITNTLLQTFQPVIQAIGTGAQWIYDNWSTLEPIFYGLAAAVALYTLMTTIQTAVTWLQVAANRALIASLMSNPILWIAVAIGVVIGMIYKWVHSVGGLRVAWLIVVDAILKAWDWVKIAFFTGVYFVCDLWDKMKLALMKAGFAITSFMGDMKVGVLTILQNLINGAIDIINKFIGLLNKIPGVNIDLIGQVTFAATAAAENEAAKQAGKAAIAQYEADIAAAAQERDSKLATMKAEAAANAQARQAEIDAARAAAQQNDAAEDTARFSAETAANTAKLADSMDIMEDNLQYLRDIAERETINRFTTAEIHIEQTNNNTINSELDIDGVMNKWNKDFLEILETSAEGVA